MRTLATSLRLALVPLTMLAPFHGFGLSSASAQDVPARTHFQGRLTDASNNPLTGPNSFVFEIFDAPAAGALLWTEAQPAVPVANGVFAVQLGAATPLPSTVFSGSTAYLQVTVNGNVMTPRERLVSVPFSHNTQLLSGRAFAAFVSTDAATQNIAGAKTFTGTVFVPAPTAPGHAASKAYVDSAGGTVLLSSTNTWSGQNSFLNLVSVSSDLVITGVLNRGTPLSLGGPLSVAAGVTAASGTFTASGPAQFSLQTSSGVSVGGAGGIYANFFSGSFYGSGAGLTGLSGTDATKVAKTGDAMTGPLTLSGSTLTVTGDAFSVGGSTLAVINGSVGVGTAAPLDNLEIQGSGASAGLRLASNAASTTAGTEIIRFGTYVGGVYTPTAILGDTSGADSNLKIFALQGNMNLGANTGGSASTRMIVNTSGGVTIGGTDQALAAHLLYIDGLSKFVVDTAGNVGVGTASPANRLDVSGGGMILRSSMTLTGVAAPAASAAGQGALYFDSAQNKFLVSENGGAYQPLGNAGTYVARTGDTMTGQLTNTSTVTVLGNAFSVGGSTLVVSGGKVGLGTTTPASALHVKADGASLRQEGDKPVFLSHNSSAFSTPNRRKIHIGWADDSRFAVEQRTDSEAGLTFRYLSFDLNNGNTGVGTSAVAPLATLHAEGNTPFIASSAGIELIRVTGSSVAFAGGAVVMRSTAATAGHAFLRLEDTAGIELLRAQQNGRIGLGTTTPAARLDVEGDARFGAGAAKSAFSATGVLTFPSGYAPSAALDAANKGYVDGQVTGGSGWTKTGTIVALTGAGDNAVVQSTLTVQGNAFSVGGSTLVITGGNVGIGTMGPGNLLHVLGSAGGSELSALKIQNDAAAAVANKVGMEYTARTSVGVRDVLNITGSFTNTTDATRNSLAEFQTANNGVFATAMAIHAGNVGIGTTGPGATLHISSAATAAATPVFIVSSGTAVGQELLRVEKDGGVGISGALKIAGAKLLQDFGDANRLFFQPLTPNQSLNISIAPNGASGTPGLELFKTDGNADRINIESLRLLANQSTNRYEIRTAAIGTGSLRDLAFLQGAADVMTLATTGSVGIGTTNPVTTLDVNGGATIRSSMTLTGVAAPAASAAGQGALYFDSAQNKFLVSENGGAYQPLGNAGTYVARAGDAMTGPLTMLSGSTVTVTGNAFSVGGSTLVVTGGRVGIGTASPGNASLAVRGAVDFVNQYPQLQVGDSATTMNINMGTGNDGGAKYGFIQSTESGVSNDRALVLQKYGGNVGIGTTLPGSRLDVAGGSLRVRPGSGAAHKFEALVTDTVSADLSTNYGVLAFSVAATQGGIPAERVRIAQSGNVGVGTTAPTSKLEVAGDIRTSGGGDLILNPAVSGATMYLYNDFGELNVTSGTASQMLFTVKSGGNVGVGTATPAQKLDVRGGLMAYGVSVSTANGSRNALWLAMPDDFNHALYNDFSNIDGEGGWDGAKWNVFSGLNVRVGPSKTSALYIDSSGGVGIGTTAPANRLDIAGGGMILRSSMTLAGVAAPAASAAGQGALYFDSAQNKFLVSENGGAYQPLGNAGTYVARTGDAMTGPLTMLSGSTITISGNAFSVGGSTFVVTSGKVGVGTTSPNAPLHVHQASGQGLVRVSGAASASVFLQDDAVGGVTYQLDSGAQQAGMFSITHSGVARRLVIDSSGNVGLGTSNPGAKLDVAGHQLFSVPGASITFNAGGPTIGVPAGNTLAFGTSGIERMRLDNLGNLGIGTNGPGHQLQFGTHFNGTVANAKMFVNSGAYNAWNGKIAVSPDGNAAVASVISSYHDNTLNVQKLGLGTIGYSGVEQTMVLQNGNVGIRTETPANPLQVSLPAGAGTPYVAVNQTADNPYLELQRWTGSGSNYEGVRIKDIVGSGGILAFETVQNGGAAIGAQTFTERMRIQGGNVGMGTTNPLSKLHVLDGDIRVSTSAGQPSKGIVFQDGTIQTTAAGGGLSYSAEQNIVLGLGTETWIKLATFSNRSYARIRVGIGSTNSEEEAEIEVITTYYAAQSAINIHRQTYNERLREVRVTGADGGNKTVYIKVRTSDFAPTIAWQVVESKGFINVNNIEEVPAAGATLVVNGNATVSTNAGMNITGNVGIGTTNPLARLSILEAAGSGNLEFGNASGGTYIQSYDRGTSAYKQTRLIASDFRFEPSGTERVRIDVSGNVGVGTTNPTERLQFDDVASGSDIRIARKAAAAHAAGNVPSSLRLSINDGGEGGVFVMNQRNLANTFNDQYIRFDTHEGGVSVGERVRIAPNGNVGIGTTSPAAVLDVDKAPSGTPYMMHIRNQNAANPYSLSIEEPAGAAAAYPLINVTNSGGSTSRFRVDSGNYTGMHINSIGNVGVGTTSPGVKLAILDATSPSVHLRRDATNEWYLTGTPAGSDRLGIRAGGNADANERVSILTGGNVGISTTTPTERLMVIGNAKVGDATSAGTVYYQLLGHHDIAGGSGFRMQFDRTSDIFGIAREFSGFQSPSLVIKRADGNVGIGTTNPGERLTVSGSIQRNNIRQSTISRSLNGATAGNFVNIGTFAQNTAGIYAKFKLYGTVTNTVQMVEYEFHNTDYPTNGGWIELPFKAGMRFGGGHSFAVDVRQTLSNVAVEARIRLLQVNGVEVLPLTIEVETNTAFTPDSTAGAGATVGAGYLAQEAFHFPVSASRWTNSESGVFINSGGNVGVGVTAPGARLEVSGQAGTPARNMILSNSSAEDATTRFIDFIRSGVDSEFIVYNNGDVRADGTFAAPADYAELFFSDDATLKPGELVCLAGAAKVKRCGDGGVLIGVVSTKPGVLGIYADDITVAAEERDADPHWVKVGLMGQIPTKFSSKNGGVKSGDQLAVGAAGAAVKGDSPRTLLLIALEDAASDGTVRALVK